MAEEAGGSGLNIHPMEQFEVHPLFGGGAVHWYTPTTPRSGWRWSCSPSSLLMVYGSRGRALVPTRMQSIAESIYGFAHKMIEDVAGKGGLKYFPYIMTLFLFILVRQPAGADPRQLRLDLAYRGHRASGARGLHQRDGDRLHEARDRLPEALLGGERADAWRCASCWR